MVSLKEAARKGDTKALEALMNQSFAPKGIMVQVTSSGALLKIGLSSAQEPSKQLIQQIKYGLSILTPEGFSEVSIKAGTIGQGPNWQERWVILKPVDVPVESSASALKLSQATLAG